MDLTETSIRMMAAAEEKEKGATKIQIYHTNKGAVFRPGKEPMEQTGLLFPKTPTKKKKKHHKPSILQDKNHHLTGSAAVHRCQETQNILHQIGQQEFEKTHTREEFRKIFGRSYL